jgi:hypothetical protein
MQRARAAAPPALLVALVALAGCGERAAPDDETNPVRAAEIARITPASEAIAGAHIPTLDPATLLDAEIEKVLGPGPRCEFRYTSEGRPVLAARGSAGNAAPDAVVKLNGHLVPLSRARAETGSLVLSADSVRLTVPPDGGEPTGSRRQREANAIFEVGESLRVGYRGYYRCAD